jgi:3-methyladenine DNA glycosylase AlkD
MTHREVISKLESTKNPRNVEGMARFGIKFFLLIKKSVNWFLRQIGKRNSKSARWISNNAIIELIKYYG